MDEIPEHRIKDPDPYMAKIENPLAEYAISFQPNIEELQYQTYKQNENNGIESRVSNYGVGSLRLNFGLTPS